VLHVVNTGSVVPPDRLDSVREPFTRLDQRTRTNGFGLGLALVESIAAIHGGTLTITAPDDGGGLCVTVRLPFS
jgi:two-component system sensor histidine kinase VanS